MKKWKVLDSKMAFDNKWFKVRQDAVELANGQRVDDFFVWLEGEVVLIVPVTPDGKFVLVKQYKHASGEIVIEFPAGMLDGNEAPQTGAQRELEEETGYGAKELLHIGTVMNNPTKAVGRIHIFLAENAVVVHQTSFDENEEIEVLIKSKDEVSQMITDGEIKVTGTITGYFLACNRLHML